MTETKVRIPKQQRSVQKKQLLKEAAIELFSKNGYHNTSSNEIAKHAKVSIGTFYSYFKNKDSLCEELIGDFYANTLSKVKDIDLTDFSNPILLVQTYLRVILKEHEILSDFQKELHCLFQQYDHFRTIEEQHKKDVLKNILSLFEVYSDVLNIKDIALSSIIIQHAVESIIHSLVFFDAPYDKEQILDELSNMLCTYLIKPEYLQKYRAELKKSVSS